MMMMMIEVVVQGCGNGDITVVSRKFLRMWDK